MWKKMDKGTRGARYTAPTGKNMKREMMHLTNYAVNCKNPDFEQNEDPDDIHDGHKRCAHLF